VDPTCQHFLPPCSTHVWPHHRRVPPLPAMSAALLATKRCRLRALTLPRHQNPSLTPLNPALPSVVINAITPTVTTRPPLPRHSPAPTKGHLHPWRKPHQFPLSLSSFVVLHLAFASNPRRRHSSPPSHYLSITVRALVSPHQLCLVDLFISDRR
jgi:hypothetical protein